MESRLEPLLDGGQLRVRMPQAAAFFRAVAELTGEAHVLACIRLALALRRAVAADDFALVSALYRQAREQRIEPAHAVEAGLELGVSPEEIRQFAARHRAARRNGSDAT